MLCDISAKFHLNYMFKNLFTKIYLKIRVTGKKIHNILFKVNHMKEQIY